MEAGIRHVIQANWRCIGMNFLDESHGCLGKLLPGVC